MIHLSDVSFAYQKQRLFQRLDLSLSSGHIYGLLGRNGAGKSSLLRLICGLLFPDSGSVMIANMPPARRKPEFLQQLFFIPEEIYLPEVSISRYEKIYAPFYPKYNPEQFRYFLKEFSVDAEAGLPSLSFGQKKKVLIAFALACNTRLLIMDEPTNGLDIPSKSKFKKMLASVTTDDKLILVSTHQVQDLENLIDSLVILEDSRILLHRGLDEIAQKLHFGNLSSTEGNEQVLYAEAGLQGYSVVMENATQQESKVRLEQLFQATLENPERIQQLLGYQKHQS
jgi:ABC-2 type transport system ATP-binding protein